MEEKKLDQTCEQQDLNELSSDEQEKVSGGASSVSTECPFCHQATVQLGKKCPNCGKASLKALL
ncbi:MAG: hypothetical protein PUC00_10660 [Clostridiales bacterium]|nr:hypothetical protein [Clostridiales bacterium]